MNACVAAVCAGGSQSQNADDGWAKVVISPFFLQELLTFIPGRSYISASTRDTVIGEVNVGFCKRCIVGILALFVGV